jgi:hypothetical protein
MDKNSVGYYYQIFHVNYMRFYLLNHVEISTNPNDTYRNLHLFRHFLEFLSLRIQMRSYLQNNINKLLYSYTILRNHWIDLLDHRTWDV